MRQLKSLSCQAFGKPLTHSFECELLSTDIRKVTGQAISPQTLRRLFGFLRSDFSPAVRTLNTLALYTGFTGWHGFLGKQARQEDTYRPLTLAEEAGLYLDFYKVDLRTEADMNYHNAARNMALRILFNPGLLAALAPALARHPVAQVYFFERFPFIDGLCGPYRRFLPLYLQKKGREAQLYGNNLLFLSAWLCGDLKEQQLFINRIRRLPLDESLHPFIIGRSIGSQLLYELEHGRGIDRLLAEAQRWQQHFLRREPGGVWQFPYFPFVLADYLNLAGYYEESHALLRPVMSTRRRFSIEPGYPEALQINWQLARHRAAPAGFLEWSSGSAPFEGLSPLFARFYRLQVALVRHRLLPAGRRKEKTAAEIRALVALTGFTRFGAGG
ncbi:hypothetical protein GCM10023184_03140 [Flaviaesturariibacter amylovorans]|uniref:DUF2515 domain-containing protein n=1 Tax=Flaviaesturariibacter amylovorans TaxID=1084520 RepID=A0ABP8G7E3_9BACT